MVGILEREIYRAVVFVFRFSNKRYHTESVVLNGCHKSIFLNRIKLLLMKRSHLLLEKL